MSFYITTIKLNLALEMRKELKGSVYIPIELYVKHGPFNILSLWVKVRGYG